MKKRYETDSGFFFSNEEELGKVLEKQGILFENQEQKKNVCKLVMLWIKSKKFKGRIKFTDVLDEISATLKMLIQAEEREH